MLFKNESIESWKIFRYSLNCVNISLKSLNKPLLSGLLGSIAEALSLYLIIPFTKILLDENKNSWPILCKISDNYETQVIVIILLIFTLTIVKHIFFYISNISALSVSHLVNEKLRSLLFQKYLSFGKLYFDKRKQAHIIAVIKNHANSVSSLVTNMNGILLSFLMLSAHLTLMFILYPFVTLIIALGIPLLSLGLSRFVKNIAGMSVYKVELQNKIGKTVLEVLNSLVIIKTYNSESKHIKAFEDLVREEKNISMKMQKKIALLSPLREITGLLVFFAAMSYFYFNKDSMLNELPSIGVYALLLRSISGKLAIFNDIASVFATKIGELKKIEEVLQEKDSYKIKSGNKIFDKLKNEIRFENVCFDYDDDRGLFDRINITIPQGKSTAIIGESGSGKSSLVNLLMRIYEPHSGTIYADGTDISEFSIKSWTSNFAVVTQEPIILSESLRDNLKYSLDDATEESINSAIKMSMLTKALQKSPHGLEMQLGDRGVKLSQGEKQRVSIARAFIKNAQILILDEPTSSLDAETEQELQNSLAMLCSDKTVIIIAHRLSTIKDADYLIFLNNGMLVEHGCPKELLSNTNSYFHKYWQIQSLTK